MRAAGLGPAFRDRAELDSDVAAVLEELVGTLLSRGVPLAAALASLRRVARRADGWGRQ